MRSMRSAVSTLCTALALVALLDGPARARRFELGVGQATRWIDSSSVQALTDDSLAMLSIDGSVDMPWFGLFGFDVALAGSLELGSVDGTSFGTMTSETSVTMLSVGARVRRTLSPRWHVHGRAMVGGGRVAVVLDETFSVVDPLSDTGYAAGMYLGAGMDLLLIRPRPGGKRWSFGLRSELGYQAMSGVSLDAVPESRMDSEGMILIPQAHASLGDLDLSAWSARLAVFGRF